ncbi:unnamed protein product [Thelazia callipaeda]|uniref:Rad9 n=1 Tax=Thelazia callipaeda TaxID=103827 RepID=A0A0N5CKA0_THECL|nr:unnamed protein product [Thelazia callipaeda]
MDTGRVYSFEELLIIRSNESQKVEFCVPPNFFYDVFMEDWNISVTAFARVLHSNERFYTQQILTLLKPTVSVRKLQSSESKTLIGTEEMFEISIKNSTTMLLTGCEIRIDGAGLTFKDSPKSCGPIEASATLLHIAKAVRRTNSNENKIVVVFNCDQFKNVRIAFICN